MEGDILVMQFKVHIGIHNWSGSICLWKTDNEGKPMLPKGDPPLLAMAQHIKMHKEVISGLKGYINFWQNLSNGSFVPRYYRLVIDY